MVKTALVTGSAGFLGRYFVEGLTAMGFSVDGLDTAHHEDQDVRLVLPTLTHRYDVVVHAAAYVKGRAAIDGQRTFLGAYNTQLDACVFQWALLNPPRHLVYLSSSAVYPVMCQTDLDSARLHEALVDPRREVLLRPDATYGFTKLVGERLAQELSDESPSTSVHVVRPFSGYGVDQDLDYPFPSFAERARRRADPFVVWGTGQQVRDWVHVTDVVGATLAVVDADYRQPVNVCTGRGTNFLQLAAMFMTGAGYHGLVETNPAAPTGVFYRVGDPSLMSNFYTPRVDLEEGVARAVSS
jgi:nucleoside-diphosphate-sugar epimerase